MKNLKVILVTLIVSLALFSPVLSAQDSDYHAVIDTFFARFAANDATGAVDYIYSDSLWLYGESESIQDLKSKISTLNEKVGDYVDHELLIEEKILDNAVYLIYLVLLEDHPFLFEFKFYKPRTRWYTYGFSYNDDLYEVLETRAAYKLNIENAEE